MKIKGIARSAVAITVVGCWTMAACGGSPTNTASGDTNNCFDDTKAELQDIYDQLEGLSMDEREAKLQELAADKGPVTITASTNPDDAKITYPAFTEATGVEVELQSADADSGRARLVEEIRACHAGTDIIIADATEVAPLDREGWLLNLDTPATDPLPPEAKFGNFADNSFNVYVAAWNTDQVASDGAPQTWEDVLAWPEEIAVDVGDYAWFATLVKEYFVKEKGMTEQEAVDLFRNAAERMVPTDGHTLMVELLLAGEFSMVADAYQHRVRSVSEEGAPVTWDSPAPVEPVIVRPGGTGMPVTADNLPGALLYMDWSLSEESAELSVQLNRTPALPVEGGLDPDLQQIPVSRELLTDPEEVEKWEDLWESIIRQSGEEVIVE